METIPGFKAYDIRGKVPSELNNDLAYKVGKAFVKLENAKKVVIGRDVRKSSPELAEALSKGLTDAGCETWASVYAGVCTTEPVPVFASLPLPGEGRNASILSSAISKPLRASGASGRSLRPISPTW